MGFWRKPKEPRLFAGWDDFIRRASRDELLDAKLKLAERAWADRQEEKAILERRLSALEDHHST